MGRDGRIVSVRYTPANDTATFDIDNSRKRLLTPLLERLASASARSAGDLVDYVDGLRERLHPRSALSPITRAVNGEQAYHARGGRRLHGDERRARARLYVTLRVSVRPAPPTGRTPTSSISGTSTSTTAATRPRGPALSNHGLGLAVDLATEQMRRIVDKIGHKYGWAKEWSDAQSDGGTCATAPASGTATSATRSSRRARPSATRSASLQKLRARRLASPSA